MPSENICPKCGAIWKNGVHFWATGTQGNELDLAGLVCNVVQDAACINPRKGDKGGQTFQDRMGKVGQEDVAE